jgi:hypothetical protein
MRKGNHTIGTARQGLEQPWAAVHVWMRPAQRSQPHYCTQTDSTHLIQAIRSKSWIASRRRARESLREGSPVLLRR